jgi:hypothetical protein
MNIPGLLFRSIFTKTTLAALTLGGILTFAGAPTAKANTWDDCRHRIDYTNYHYQEAIEHFGPYSGQARHWAHERQEAYERLDRLRRDHHRDYDRDWR